MIDREINGKRDRENTQKWTQLLFEQAWKSWYNKLGEMILDQGILYIFLFDSLNPLTLNRFVIPILILVCMYSYYFIHRNGNHFKRLQMSQNSMPVIYFRVSSSNTSNFSNNWFCKGYCEVIRGHQVCKIMSLLHSDCTHFCYSIVQDGWSGDVYCANLVSADLF